MGLIYDVNAGILTVRLIEVSVSVVNHVFTIVEYIDHFFFHFFTKAHDLRARELSGIADPYAKIRLLPDRNNVWQTTIHRRTLNPGKYFYLYRIIAK